jgi:hypothetical protein
MALITILSFDGFSLNNANFSAYGTGIRKPPDAKPVFIEVPMSDAVYSGMYTMDVRSVPMTVVINDWQNRYELESQLKEALKPGREGTLKGRFAGTLQEYQINCVVQSIIPDTKKDGIFTVIMQSGESCWRTTELFSDEWEITASGDTKTINVGGYSPTRLNLQVTPTGLPASGWVYQRLYQLTNKPDYAYGLRPWCIEIDTATLVTAGKMQADCDDIKLVIDGIEAKRWIADANTSATKVWTNLNISEGYSLTLLTAIPSSGSITEIKLEKTSNNRSALKSMATKGIVAHGTEWLQYTGIDTKKYKLTGVTRAVHNTSMQSHSEGDTFAWIEHAIYVLYGNSAAEDPSTAYDTYDDEKPLFDLSASDNETWVYTAATKFYDPDKPKRTGAWTYSKTATGTDSEYYEESEEVEGGDPAMGAKITTWYKGGKEQKEKAIIAWSMNHAGGFASVSMTGQKYRSTSLWPATTAIELQRANSKAKRFYSVWDEPTPSAEDTWEAITHADAAISSEMPNIRFVFEGTLSATEGAECMFEVLTTTVEFVAANQPTGTLGDETENYFLSAEIENLTNEQKILLTVPMKLDRSLILDGEEYEITYDGADAYSSLELDDESRSIWLELDTGDNELKITGDDVGNIDIVLSWYERRM